ncbi:MAG: peptidylprolyl isomerase, partial [Planctomycetota bacterium]|nr:peptidylprolyl isomerase [Planctomycetota bacterium]
MKARQILVSHKDADQSRHSRSRENAQKRANRIHSLLSTSTDSKKFGDLAKKVSDALDKESGGALPPFRLQNLEESAAKAFSALKPGAFSAPVETRFGFHIFLRESSEEYGLEQRLFRFKGAERCPESESQSEAEAKAAAEKLLKTLKKDDDFKGEILGLVTPSMLAKEVAGVLAKLKPGQLHRSVIKSKFGFHIVRRIPIELASASHILIDHELGFQSVSLRTKEDAKKVAEQVLKELKKDPKRFLELHEKHSADKRPSLGVIPRKGPQALSAIQDALFQVAESELCESVLESRYGF